MTICDASLGYHLAPVLGRKEADSDDDAIKSTKNIRKLLSLVVAFYAFLDCLAYSRDSLGFLLVVAFIIVLDMGAQIILIKKFRKNPSI